MKKNLLNIILLLLVTMGVTSCLKENRLYTDYGSTAPMADITKAPANAATVATAPTNSWEILDSSKTEVDYLTAVHLSAKNHVGDITLKMKIDTAAAKTFITRIPFFVQDAKIKSSLTGKDTTVKDTVYYKVLPTSLYSVASYDVKIENAGVFTTADFPVRIKIGTKDADGENLFNHTYQNKHFSYILPVTIESVEGDKYGIASNFRTILWRIRVK